MNPLSLCRETAGDVGFRRGLVEPVKKHFMYIRRCWGFPDVQCDTPNRTWDFPRQAPSCPYRDSGYAEDLSTLITWYIDQGIIFMVSPSFKHRDCRLRAPFG